MIAPKLRKICKINRFCENFEKKSKQPFFEEEKFLEMGKGFIPRAAHPVEILVSPTPPPPPGIVSLKTKTKTKNKTKQGFFILHFIWDPK